MAERDRQPIKVFVGSPNDMEEHRAEVERAIALLNRMKSFPEQLEYHDWKTSVPPGAGRPQAQINEVLLTCDIFVAIFGGRLGSSTGEAAAGTVEEYTVALERRKREKRPDMLVYFQQPPGPRSLREAEDMRAVFQFKEDIEQKRREVLTGNLAKPHELFGLAQLHLHQTIERWKTGADREADPDDQEKPRDDEQPRGDERQRDDDADPGSDLIGLRLKLEAKLAWLAKHLLSGDETPTFATIGSLEHDGYLPTQSARRCARLLALDPELVRAEAPEAAAVADDVSNFRATVFDRYVRRLLERKGWVLEEFPQGDGHRPDFLAIKDGRRFRVAPRLATTRDSPIRNRTVARLERSRGEGPEVQRRIVVIPDVSSSPPTDADADPQVVKLEHLVASLGA